MMYYAVRVKIEINILKSLVPLASIYIFVASLSLNASWTCDLLLANGTWQR